MPSPEHYVLLDWQPHIIRAGVGVHEVIRRPSNEISTRVALRIPRPKDPQVSDYLVGAALDEALKSGEQVEIIWPFVPSTDDAYEIPLDVLDTHDEKARRNRNKTSRQRRTPGVTDWVGLEALFRHVLFSVLNLPSRPVNYHVAVAMPAPINIQARERLTQIFFENMFVPALVLNERSLADIYAVGTTSGLVVEIGRAHTCINYVHDSSVAPWLVVSPLGHEDCDNYLAHLLLTANPELPKLLSPSKQLSEAELHDALLAVVRSTRETPGAIVFNSPLLKLGILDLNETKDDEEIDDVAKLAATGKLNQIVHKDEAANTEGGGEDTSNFDPTAPTIHVPHPLSSTLPQIPVGLERHRYAEPLFEPSLLSNLPRYTKYPSSTSTKSSQAQSQSQDQQKDENSMDVDNANVNSNSIDNDIQKILVKYTSLDIEKKSFTPVEATAAAVRLIDPEGRPNAWENLVLTGDCTFIQGVQEAFVGAAARFLIDPESGSDIQPRHVRFLKVPDYFIEYKEPRLRPDLLPFLGVSIMAKVFFADYSGKSYLSKVDYNSKGPTIATRKET